MLAFIQLISSEHRALLLVQAGSYNLYAVIYAKTLLLIDHTVIAGCYIQYYAGESNVFHYLSVNLDFLLNCAEEMKVLILQTHLLSVTVLVH